MGGGIHGVGGAKELTYKLVEPEEAIKQSKVRAGNIEKTPTELSTVSTDWANHKAIDLRAAYHQDAIILNETHCDKLGGVKRQTARIRGIACLKFTPTTPKTKDEILYVHGGGFIAGSPASHIPITAHMAKESGATVHSMKYPLAPETKHPAQRDAVITAIKERIKALPKGAKLVVAGDSAGAAIISLALAELGRTDAPECKRISSFISFYGAFGRTEGTGIDAAGRDTAMDGACLKRYYRDAGLIKDGKERKDLKSPEDVAEKLPRGIRVIAVAAGADPVAEDSELLVHHLNALEADSAEIIRQPDARHGFMKDVAYVESKMANTTQKGNGDTALGVMQAAIGKVTWTSLD